MTEKILSNNGIADSVIKSPLVEKLTKFHAKYANTND